MKLAISNIAWEHDQSPTVLPRLQKLGVQGIEIAPSKVWVNWEGASQSAAERYRQELLNWNFEVPALQAILFGKEEISVFDPSSHDRFKEHIKLVADVAAGLQAKVLVFGAPKARKRGQLASTEAMLIAEKLFRELGAICVSRGCVIGIEHNPVEYMCDFLTNAADAEAFVKMVDHPGVRLHLDSAGLHLCGGDIGHVISTIGEFDHFHISEPMLAPIAGGSVDQSRAIGALKSRMYKGWVSIEMKPTSLDLLEESVRGIAQLLV